MSRAMQHAAGRWAVALAVGAVVMLSACTESPVTPREQPVKPLTPQLLTSAFNGYEFLGFVTDDAGANDTPAQSDLNAFTRADNVTGFIGVQWVWDDVNSWTGEGQTGDACALFDTDNDTKANAAVCVRIENPNGDPNVIAQLPSPLSPLVYSCGDNKADRCAQPANPVSIGATVCEVEKINGETFFTEGEDGADVLAACAIPLSVISTSVTPNLLNVCSFPSGSPNSNPFDCVVTPGAGFLIIKKATGSTTPSNNVFSFTVNPAPVTGTNPYTITDNTANDEQTSLLSAAPGNAYSVTEGTLPAGWTLDAASCARQTSPTPTATGTKSGNAVTGISITSGETTICTFTNSQVAPTMTVVKAASPDEISEVGGTVQYTVTVTNTSSISITLDSLIDDQFGDLDGKGTCNSAADPTNPYGSIAPSGTYTCVFEEELDASEAEETHINEASAYATSDAGPLTESDTAKVTFTDELPDISVVKVANKTEIEAEGGASVAGFTPDQTFDRDDAGGSGGPNDPVFQGDTCDDAGPNDEPAQSDLNCFSRADNVAGRLWLRWSWDDINAWTGEGQTGDACALLDTDDNSKANFAFCARVTNPNGDPTQIAQVAGSPILYKCKDVGGSGEIDRCASKTQIQTLDASSVCTIDLAGGDLLAGGEDGDDSLAECNLKLTDLGPNTSDVDLLNVCSFPSGSPNSNPFDCVVTPGAGYLVINKLTTPTDAEAYFAFTLRNAADDANATATNGDTYFAVQGGAISSAIPILPGTYAILEQMPTGWSLDADGINCTRDGVSISGQSTSDDTQLGVTIVQGQTTICTFENSLTASESVEFTVTVTNNGPEDITWLSLEDTENPGAGETYATLNGVGTCVTGAMTIAGSGGTYECKFSRTISGPPGTEHNNKVKAVGKDNELNADTEYSAIVTVTIVIASP